MPGARFRQDEPLTVDRKAPVNRQEHAATPDDANEGCYVSEAARPHQGHGLSALDVPCQERTGNRLGTGPQFAVGPGMTRLFHRRSARVTV